MKVPTWIKDSMRVATMYVFAIFIVIVLAASFPYHTYDQWRFARAAKKNPTAYSRCALERCGEWGSHKRMTQYPGGSGKWYHDEICYDKMSRLYYMEKMVNQNKRRTK